MVNTWLFYSCWIYTIYQVLGQKQEQKQIFHTMMQLKLITLPQTRNNSFLQR